MKQYLIPATGILLVAIILIVINEKTGSTFVHDYAYLLIILAMLAGVGLARLSDRKG